eukprot:CAMPEP_0171290154 /NCGR_PEP_ID=MMETSP0790-20130122/71001_1 /TAXON_ID=2925 /ORGANISM="Alexandrium catenella, Strain OF101" /LENGTH=46 /DNA_ID= /DNA_START= /DNA_END= /DNA_ORIENTATION=
MELDAATLMALQSAAGLQLQQPSLATYPGLHLQGLQGLQGLQQQTA